MNADHLERVRGTSGGVGRRRHLQRRQTNTRAPSAKYITAAEAFNRTSARTKRLIRLRAAGGGRRRGESDLRRGGGREESAAAVAEARVEEGGSGGGDGDGDVTVLVVVPAISNL